MGTFFTLNALLVSDLWLSHTMNTDILGLSAGADIPQPDMETVNTLCGISTLHALSARISVIFRSSSFCFIFGPSARTFITSRSQPKNREWQSSIL